MALILKPKYQIDVLGTTLYVTDITGQYGTVDVVENEGGWGVLNPSLADSALVALVQRFIGTTGSSLQTISNQIIYDNTALETKETQFTFTTGLDGHIKITLFRLPVSLNGATTVELAELQEGDFFYWNNVSLIWKIENSLPVVVTVEELIGVTSVTQTTCEDLMFPSLAIKYNTLYRLYVESRDTSCNSAEAKFQELLHLRMDLYGAKTLFRSGLTTLSEDVINTLLQRYDLAV